MKRLCRSFFVCIMLVTSFIFSCLPVAIAAETPIKNLREFLVSLKSVSEVYPINDNLTFVIPKSGTLSSIDGDFDEELLKFCRNHGTMEAEFVLADPLTRKQTKTWSALKLTSEGKFIHPVTGEEKTFKGNLLYLGIAVKGAVTAPVRVKDFMEVIEVFNVNKAPRTMIIKTKDKQPFLYKIDTVPSYDKIAMPPDGDIIKNVAEMKESKNASSLFKNRLSQGDADVFVYLTALCRKFNLTPKYIINEGEFIPVADAYIGYFVKDEWQSGYFKFKLKAISSPLDMFKYMANLDLDQIKNKFNRWYFGGTGDKKFVALGSVEKRIDEKDVVSSQSLITFANDRGFDGIEYAAETKKDAPVNKPAETSTPQPALKTEVKKDVTPDKRAATATKQPEVKTEVKKDVTLDKPAETTIQKPDVKK